jgi:hypothetical protein
MFDPTPVQSRVRLSDGCTVRLDIRSHPKPVFVADKCGNHYDVAGYFYDLEGRPMDEKTPAIIEIVPYQ